MHLNKPWYQITRAVPSWTPNGYRTPNHHLHTHTYLMVTRRRIPDASWKSHSIIRRADGAHLTKYFLFHAKGFVAFQVECSRVLVDGCSVLESRNTVLVEFSWRLVIKLSPCAVPVECSRDLVGGRWLHHSQLGDHLERIRRARGGGRMDQSPHENPHDED